MKEPVAGKFLLEILTRGMYSNPMHIYREYIQNSADAIDAAIKAGIISLSEATINVDIDANRGDIHIKDNGIGIQQKVAQAKLLNVGASDKDGVTERGFRGIGRLGGLAYASQVQFITSAFGDETKTIMTCDCNRLQKLLQKSNNETSDIMETFKAISSFEQEPEDLESHYFEVIMTGVMKESGLLNESDAIKYLAETAPIDFDSQQFTQARKIREKFIEQGFPITCYKILRGKRQQPIFKLYSRSITTGKQERSKNRDYIRDVEFVFGKTSDGKPLYMGWIALTDFSGSISNESIQGIRFRKGNILVGNNETFSSFFPLSALEASRANKVFAGEIHILHDEIVPNSQRDNFEPGPVYNEMKDSLSKWAGEINKRYRRGTSEATSALRKLNTLNEEQAKLEEKIETGVITSDEKREQIAEQMKKISRQRAQEEKKVRKALEHGTFSEDRKEAVKKTLVRTEAASKRETTISTRIIDAEYATKNDLPSSYSRNERKLYQKIISIIDNFFSNDLKIAEELRDRIRTELSVKR